MIDSLKCVEDRYSWQLEDSIWSAPSQDYNWHNTNLLRSDLRWLARWVDTTTCRLPCTSFTYERADGDTRKGSSRKAQLLPRDWHLYLRRNDPCLCVQTCSTFFKTNHVSLSSTHTHTHIRTCKEVYPAADVSNRLCFLTNSHADSIEMRLSIENPSGGAGLLVDLEVQ